MHPLHPLSGGQPRARDQVRHEPHQDPSAQVALPVHQQFQAAGPGQVTARSCSDDALQEAAYPEPRDFDFCRHFETAK